MSLKNYIIFLICTLFTFFFFLPLSFAAETVDDTGSGGEFFYSDPYIIYQARKKLYEDIKIGRFNFSVNSEIGVVSLEGEVDNEESLKLAGEIVISVSGVKELDNKLILNTALQEQFPVISDKEITEAVSKNLSTKKRVKIYRLECYTIGGRVTVEGIVDSLEAELIALETAREVKGVTSVKSNIDIDSAVSDGYILVAAKFLMIASPKAEGTKVNINVEDGIIILSGKVSSEESRESAINIARGIAGSRGVISYLEVKEEVFPDDEKVSDDILTGNIENALASDEVLSRYDIKVVCSDGIVTLFGTVDSRDIVLDAVEKVSSISGVRAVKSELEIK